MIQAFILEHTSTIGLRYHLVDRKILQRQNIEFETKYGIIKAKEVITQVVTSDIKSIMIVFIT